MFSVLAMAISAIAEKIGKETYPFGYNSNCAPRGRAGCSDRPFDNIDNLVLQSFDIVDRAPKYVERIVNRFLNVHQLGLDALSNGTRPNGNRMHVLEYREKFGLHFAYIVRKGVNVSDRLNHGSLQNFERLCERDQEPREGQEGDSAGKIENYFHGNEV